MKIAVQIDFDGTVTIEDVSFLLLDKYAGSPWRQYLKEYNSGKISVGAFNKKVFGMVKADRKTMTEFVLTSERVKIRPGFKEFLEYCFKNKFKTIVVSNGLIFYIEAIIKNLGIDSLKGLEIFASQNEFHPGGMNVAYIGPDGKELGTGFKESYTKMLIKKGYDVVYIGDGNSDIYAARKAKYVFATDQLLKRCKREKIDCIPFEDFIEVVKAMDKIK
jgi:2-hydroxy-3-keto-5-methylthiopentenyl-1-phosphate phosphatase